MTSTPEKTVFIVDDDEGVRTSLSILLDSVGYIPVPFASACDFLAQYDDSPLALFAITDKGRLRIATGTDRLDPKPGWTLTSLVNPATRREPATSPGAKVPEADPAVAPKLPD